MLAVEDSPTGRFLDRLGERLPRPRAIVVASAHFTYARPTVTATPSPETIHDFGGFPEALYRIQYPASGAPGLADQVATVLRDAGFPAGVDGHHGLDHGVWVPLRRMYPDAGIPVIALSVDPSQTSEWHYRLGRALAPLRDQGVQRGIPMMVNIHDVELARKYSDHIVGMTGGHVVYDGPPEGLTEEHLNTIYGGKAWLE